MLRYSKCLSCMRLYIEIADGELSGGTRGCPRNYEVAKEDGRWMLYETEIASTPAGEPVLIHLSERQRRGLPVECGLFLCAFQHATGQVLPSHCLPVQGSRADLP